MLISAPALQFNCRTGRWLILCCTHKPSSQSRPLPLFPPSYFLPSAHQGLAIHDSRQMVPCKFLHRGNCTGRVHRRFQQAFLEVRRAKEGERNIPQAFCFGRHDRGRLMGRELVRLLVPVPPRVRGPCTARHICIRETYSSSISPPSTLPLYSSQAHDQVPRRSGADQTQEAHLRHRPLPGRSISALLHVASVEGPRDLTSHEHRLCRAFYR